MKPTPACRELYDRNKDAFGEMADEFLEDGCAPKDFVIVCIDRSNDHWERVIALLDEAAEADGADETEQSEPVDGEPYICGMRTDVFLDIFGQLVPEVIGQFRAPSAHDHSRVVTMHGTDIAVFPVEIETIACTAPGSQDTSN